MKQTSTLGVEPRIMCAIKSLMCTERQRAFAKINQYLDAETAAKMAGHTSTVITLKHYLINEEERKMEKLRKVNNEFA